MQRDGTEDVHASRLRQSGVIQPARSSLVFYDVTHRHAAHLRCERVYATDDVESFFVSNKTKLVHICFERRSLLPRLGLKVVNEACLVIKQYGVRLPHDGSLVSVRSRHRVVQECALVLSSVVHLHVSYNMAFCIHTTKHVDGGFVGDTSSLADSNRQLTRCRPFVCLRVVSLDTTQRCSIIIH